MSLVLVYGTLKRGFGNHRLLENSEKINTFITPPEFTMVSLGGFPGVIEGGDTAIKCELYSVDERTLSSLDRLEGYPNFYSRKKFNTPHGEAWMYLLGDNYLSNPRVESGEW